jgi:hypothetical protein
VTGTRAMERPQRVGGVGRTGTGGLYRRLAGPVSMGQEVRDDQRDDEFGHAMRIKLTDEQRVQPDGDKGLTPDDARRLDGLSGEPLSGTGGTARP